MQSRRKVCILGSTGSIGVQALDVCRRNPDKLEVCGLACGRRASEMLEQAREFGVSALAVGDSEHAGDEALDAIEELADASSMGFFGTGPEGVAALVESCGADIVVNSLVGAAGLEASYLTLKSGKVLALANKESLVVGGDLIMPLAHSLDASYPKFGEHAEFRPEGMLMPIDSEHGAIYQCLLGEYMDEAECLWVTASGGPFRGRNVSELRDVTAAEALAHPTWNMGAKITIDSATLMNKGLEVIEAHHLFDAPYDSIKVVVQPQSAIHSMVEFVDGSVKAHLGATDMRIPIQFALSYPERWESPAQKVDFRTMASLGFEPPDTATFRCLSLAREAGIEGGTMPCAMNAANEVAVAAFLAGKLSFLGIAECVEHVMDAHVNSKVDSIEQLVSVDGDSRKAAQSFVRSFR